MKLGIPHIALVFLASSLPDVEVRALRDPSFGKEIFVVVEHTGADARALWDAGDEKLEEVSSDTGEALESSAFGVSLVKPGDPDPTREGYQPLAADKVLLLFRLREPKGPVKSIARFAGTYELLSGGSEHWIDVPFAEVASAKPWKNETLAAAGFELKRGVREVAQFHVRLAGETFAVRDLKLSTGGEDLENTGSDGDGDAIVYRFDLGNADAAKLVLRVEMNDGSVVEIDTLPGKQKFTRVKRSALAKAGVELEVRRAAVREVFAEGSGDFELLRGYRWVNPRGKDLGLTPTSHSSGGGTSVRTSCRVPPDLARSARLQLGLLVGAEWETKRIEHDDIELR